MTGPEHYREAEQLLAEANAQEGGTNLERFCLAAAQVHATLALAAATAFTGTATNRQDAIADPAGTEWHKVLAP